MSGVFPVHPQSEKFWIVWSPEGFTPPKYMHGERADADTESVRLARNNPGHHFYVMGAEGVAFKNDVTFLKLS